jgi:hypothetical protein
VDATGCFAGLAERFTASTRRYVPLTGRYTKVANCFEASKSCVFQRNQRIMGYSANIQRRSAGLQPALCVENQWLSDD